jgi:hypothetical protein
MTLKTREALPSSQSNQLARMRLERRRKMLATVLKKVSSYFHVGCRIRKALCTAFRHQCMDPFFISVFFIAPKVTPKKEAPAPTKPKATPDTKNGDSVSDQLFNNQK